MKDDSFLTATAAINEGYALGTKRLRLRKAVKHMADLMQTSGFKDYRDAARELELAHEALSSALDARP